MIIWWNIFERNGWGNSSSTDFILQVYPFSESLFKSSIRLVAKSIPRPIKSIHFQTNELVDRQKKSSIFRMFKSDLGELDMPESKKLAALLKTFSVIYVDIPIRFRIFKRVRSGQRYVVLMVYRRRTKKNWYLLFMKRTHSNEDKRMQLGFCV